MSSSFFRRCHVLTRHSGHLQTIYGSLFDFSLVDQVAYDRQVVSHYYTRRQLNSPSQAASPNQRWRNLVRLSGLILRSSAHCCDRGLDFTPPASDCVLPDETPIIVVLHGLTGGQHKFDYCLIIGSDTVAGSHESYVRAVLAPAVMPASNGGLGYRAVVVNFRGCTPSI